MSSRPIRRLESFAKSHRDEFPKLVPALRAFRTGFIGSNVIKDNIARSLMYYIAYARKHKARRRSKRKRRPVAPPSPVRPKRRRTASTASEPGADEVNSAAIFAAFLQAVASHNADSSDEEWEESDDESARPEWMEGPLMHVMLCGEPGTGKTTLAGLLVDLWDAIGLIRKSKYIETTRADWVGRYQGHSTAKARELISNHDCIFIDEAYSIVAGKDDLYGTECLNEIVEAMSNQSRHCLFILAGYKQDVAKLYAANRGLERRLGYIFELQRPPAPELFLIFQKQLKAQKFKLHRKDRASALAWFSQNATHLSKFGGGTTAQFVFHCLQSAIERSFPDLADKIITLRDMKYALDVLTNVGRKTTQVYQNMYI